jgi:hypothetical protein
LFWHTSWAGRRYSPDLSFVQTFIKTPKELDDNTTPLGYSRFSLLEVPMKRIFLALIACLAFAMSGVAQQSSADAPATKEDVQKYLDVMHSREMIAQMLDAMSKPMHQMMHERYMKDKDKLPADFEARMNKMMDDMMKGFPWDEILQSMVPVYQKHLTKGNIDAIVAFYSAPAGQKLLREMPAMMAEAMQTMMPLLHKHIEAMTERMQVEVAQMLKESGAKPGEKSQASPN